MKTSTVFRRVGCERIADRAVAAATVNRSNSHGDCGPRRRADNDRTRSAIKMETCDRGLTQEQEQVSVVRSPDTRDGGGSFRRGARSPPPPSPPPLPPPPPVASRARSVVVDVPVQEFSRFLSLFFYPPSVSRCIEFLLLLFCSIALGPLSAVRFLSRRTGRVRVRPGRRPQAQTARATGLGPAVRRQVPAGP